MTYSIVARDPATGQLGVAVQSHWFSVGPIVPWAVPGVGAVATQANAEISYGPRALELLAAGHGPREALDRLLAPDPAAESRQVAVMDAQGQAAVHTGTDCIPYAGHAIGQGVCCQANIMATEEVWPAMLEAFGTASGPLARRLLDALEAGEAAGGDLRGRQSAALLVVGADGPAWQAQVSLRVEDDPEPLVELRRLVSVHEAYQLADQADHLVGEGRHQEAAVLYRRASELAPGNHELRFWGGLGAAQSGDIELAVSEVKAAIAAHPPWRELLEKLPSEVAPSAAIVLARLKDQ
jgi:uncharacterized Ntn-hydrolase superfamily protein